MRGRRVEVSLDVQCRAFGLPKPTSEYQFARNLHADALAAPDRAEGLPGLQERQMGEEAGRVGREAGIVSEQQHTPGPWLVKPTSSGGLLVVRPEQSLQVFPVADAHLIAAAPELLAALQKCLSHMEINPSLYRNRSGDWVPLVYECRAAIAKAEGRK